MQPRPRRPMSDAGVNKPQAHSLHHYHLSPALTQDSLVTCWCSWPALVEDWHLSAPELEPTDTKVLTSGLG